jgi:RNA polymerase sigma-70 factor (ECF subfamily)
MSAESPRHSYDADSFRVLFDTYLDRVHDYVSAICKSEYIAEEVTQELFLILWRKRDDLGAVENMDGYVFRIARNLAIAMLKKTALDSKRASEFYKRTQKQSEETTEGLDVQAAQTLIDTAITQLPPQPRKIYLLSRKENMDYDEIAAATGLSRNTVKNHLQKALNDIREYLIRHGYQPIIAAAIIKILS